MHRLLFICYTDINQSQRYFRTAIITGLSFIPTRNECEEKNMKFRNIVFIVLPLLLSGCSACSQPEEESFNPAGETFRNLNQAGLSYGPSKVWFGKDGTYVLEDHTASAVTEYTGAWSVSENVVTLDAPEKKIIFEAQEDGTLVLKTGLSGSASDDVFTAGDLPQSTASAPPAETSPAGKETAAPASSEPEAQEYAYHNASQANPFGKSFLELYDDGTFSFTEVAGMGAVQIKGLYGQEGNTLLFSNFDAPLYDDKGNPIYNFEMDIYDEETLILRKDLSESRYGDVFTLSGTIPAGYTDPSPKEVLTTTVWKFTPEGSAGVPAGLEPNVIFDADGTFVLTENCYSGMGQFKGWYEKTSTGYICYVQDASSMQGYAGGDVTLITFVMKDDHTLLLKTDLCMSRTDNEFILQ